MARVAGLNDEYRQITLGELIRQIEGMPLTWKFDEEDEPKRIMFDFAGMVPRGVHSYRGFYSELAITAGTVEYYDDLPTAEEFLKELKGVLKWPLPGWKGGEFTMTDDTPVWVTDSVSGTSRTVVTGVRDLDHEGIVIDTATVLPQNELPE